MTSEVLSEEEKLRCVPGVYFADEFTGRRAKICDAGHTPPYSQAQYSVLFALAPLAFVLIGLVSIVVATRESACQQNLRGGA